MAMVGTGYAALKVPNKSVGAKQLKANAVITAKIKKEAVTGKKIKKGTITGANLNLAQLGTVPSATTAGTANVANSLAPLEGPHFVGEPGQPGFEGWHNIGTEGPFTYGRVEFYKDHDGIVHLEGVAEEGSSGPFIFTLPPGFRPASGQVRIFEPFEELPVYIFGSNTSIEGFSLSGKLLAFEGVAVLDGITFRAES
jgi:hypothetical protein